MSSTAHSLWFRGSLFCRGLLALGILGACTLPVVAVATLVGIWIFFAFFSWLLDITFLVELLPRLSVSVPWSPTTVAVGSFVGVLFVFWAISRLIPDPDEQSTRHRVGGYLLLVLLCGLLYVIAVESTMVLAEASLRESLPLMVSLGALVGVPAAVSIAREELDQLREQLVEDSYPAAETHPELVTTTTQLALQAGVRSPTLRITQSDRPESFTLARGSDAVIVVSTGLCAALSDDELTAVLAHEVSHLANADSRLMGIVLVPVLAAEEFLPQITPCSQLAVAILSRGREWHADAGAVALTGSPAALASALATLSEQRKAPSTDLREWEQSVSALDILPPSNQKHATGPFRTHPSTDDRIERLRQQVANAERA